VDAVDQAQIDHVDAELGVDHVAHGLLDVGDGGRRGLRHDEVPLRCECLDCGVLEGHPGQQGALDPGRVLGHPGERDPVLQDLLVRLDLAARADHLGEGVHCGHRLVDRLAGHQLVQHAGRSLADRAAHALVRHVDDLAVGDVHPQVDLVAAGRVDVADLRFVGLAQTPSPRLLVMVQDDVLVELFQVHQPNTFRTLAKAATRASISSVVL
jgi:hypothetical protein